MLGVLFLLWLLAPSIAGFIIRRQLVEAETLIGRSIHFDTVELHGLSGIDVKGIVIEGPTSESRPLLKLDRAEIRLAHAILWGLEIDSVHLVAPEIYLRREADKQTNFQDIIQSIKAHEGETREPPPEVPELKVSEGTVTFEDHFGEQFRPEKLEHINLVINKRGVHNSFNADLLLTLRAGDAKPLLKRPLSLRGHFGKKQPLHLALAFGDHGTTLPLSTDTDTIPALRLHGITLDLPPAETGGSFAFALSESSATLRYGVGPLRWREVSTLTNLDWLEELLEGFNVTKKTSDPDAPSTDPGAASATSIRAWTEGSKAPMSNASIRPLLIDPELYREQWEVRSTGGEYELYAAIFLTNMGFGDGRVVVRGDLKRKGESEPQRFEAAFSSREWTLAEDELTFTFGSWTLTGELGKFKATGVFGEGDDKIEFEWHFEGTPWRPGTGLVLYGNKGQFHREDILIADGHSTGVIKEKGKTTEVKGRASVRRTATDLAPNVLLERVFHFRSKDGPFYIEWKRIRSCEAFGFQHFDFLVVGYEQKIIFESTDVQLKKAEPYTDPGHFNYTLPRHYDVTARDGDHEVTLQLRYTDVEAFNPLDRLPVLERQFASQMISPTEFMLHGTWSMTTSEIAPSIPTHVGGDGNLRAFVIH